VVVITPHPVAHTEQLLRRQKPGQMPKESWQGKEGQILVPKLEGLLPCCEEGCGCASHKCMVLMGLTGEFEGQFMAEGQKGHHVCTHKERLCTISGLIGQRGKTTELSLI
jgi:hypothetical protein